MYVGRPTTGRVRSNKQEKQATMHTVINDAGIGNDTLRSKVAAA
jgi:hypothetical protein